MLPKSATFASFLLVAATLSLLTILLAIKIPHILSLTTHFLTPKPHKAPKNPDTKHSYIKPSRILIWAIYFRYHIWGTFNIFLHKKYDRIQACFENIRTSMRSFMRRRCPYFIYMVYVLLVDMFLWRLFITLPLSELDYDLNLFVPRRRNVVYNVNGWFYGDRLRGVQSLRSEIGYGTRIIELRAFFSLLLHSSLFRVLFCMIRTIRSSITTN